VDAETERPVPLEETRKAFEAEPGLYVAVSREEIEQSVPEPSRAVRIDRFVPTSAVDPLLFDRPYYLRPAETSETYYFALAQVLDTKKCAGIVSWVMRKHFYVGAVVAQQGYLMVITLRHTDEVIPVSDLDPPQGSPLEVKEKQLAEKLIEALSGQFEPKDYHDEYQERVRELINAKRAGKKLKPKRLQRRRSEGSLADSLRASLKGVSATRSA
jgi:DNA end-binding protein Ku